MARSALAVQNSAPGGMEPTFTAANVDGHSVVNGLGRVMIEVRNGGGSACVVTIVTPATVGGLTIEDPSSSVAAGEDWVFGPWDPSLFNQSDGSGVDVDFSQVTSVTIAALEMVKF